MGSTTMSHNMEEDTEIAPLTASGDSLTTSTAEVGGGHAEAETFDSMKSGESSDTEPYSFKATDATSSHNTDSDSEYTPYVDLEQIVNLLDDDDKDEITEAAKEAFPKLSDRIVHLSKELAKKKRKLQRQADEIDIMEETIAAKDSEISAMHKTIATKDHDLHMTREAIDDKDNDIETLNDTIDTQNSEIGRMTASVSFRDIELNNLRRTIVAKDDEIQRLKQRLIDLETGIEESLDEREGFTGKKRLRTEV
jgi:chromosome segregation ATPase